jgi:BirA family biotin operon repressor/biotin-[acetyl-CoA-carboxylase] ligase
MAKELKTTFTGKKIIRLPLADSSNTLLALWLENHKLPEGTALIADEQTAGRGQDGTTWVSERGKNLLLSIVFYPTFVKTKNIFLLSKTFALGVHDYVSTLIKADVKIKWPNDIYAGDKKLSGMLIENSLSGAHINQSILGIGINVNQKDFPDTLVNPTSLSLLLNHELSLNNCLFDLCQSIEERFVQLKKGQGKKIKQDYIDVLYRFNKIHLYETEGERIKAKIVDVNDAGQLCLQREDGTVSMHDFKSVKYL